MLGRRSLGQILQRSGVITEAQLQSALDHQARSGQRLGEALVGLGILSDAALAKALAEQLDIPYVDLVTDPPDLESVLKLPREVALEFGALPIRLEGGRMLVALRDPYDIRSDQAIREWVGVPVLPVMVAESQLREALSRYYGSDHPDAAVADAREQELVSSDQWEEDASASVEQLALAGKEMPIITMVNTLLSDAIRRGASDIHIEPLEHQVRVRYRIDGQLTVVVNTPLKRHPAVTARLKIISGMDISESRQPQDGGAQLKVDGTTFELRVSTLPSIHGETLVVRILKNSRNLIRLEQLGMLPTTLAGFRRLLSLKEGMILITGPTGSGKTTTLYAALDNLLDDAVNVITVEDPVEVRLPGVTQVQVNERAGRTFAATLRSMLRQDPDILMVGEMRDLETAEMGSRAALTGHLVLSTLHTRDSIGTVTRLVDMGVAPHIVSSSLAGVVAQRLVARNCPDCRIPYQPDDVLRRALERVFGQGDWTGFSRGQGCQHCRRTGRRGRIGVYELLILDQEMQRLIACGEVGDALRRHATERGFICLEEAALKMAMTGEISPEEVVGLGMQVALGLEAGNSIAGHEPLTSNRPLSLV